MQEYDAIIIGAGQGGLGAASALVKSGLKPLVLEKHNLPGGFVTSFVRGRFEFDATLHCMTYLDSFKPTFGDELHLTEQFPAMPDKYTVAFKKSNGEIFCHVFTTGDIPTFALEVEQVMPGCGAKASEYLSLCMELLGGAQFSQSPECTPALLMEKFPHFMRFSQMNASQVFDAIEMPADLRGLFNQFYWYIGPSLEEYNAIQYAGMIYAIFFAAKHFPVASSHGFLAELEKLIRVGGGDIWFNTEVEEVIVKDGRAVGVRTNQGDTVYAKHIISNISPRIVLERLIQEDFPKKEELIQRQREIRDNESFAVVYLGLNASPEEIGLKSHHLFIAESLDPMESYRAGYTMSRPFTIGGLCPNITDKNASPEGTCILSLSVGIQGSSMEGLTQQQYFKKKEQFAKEVVAVASEYLGINLRDYIEEIEVATPATFARYTGSRNGVIGYSQVIEENKKKMAAGAELNAGIIKGLSFVGQFATSFGYVSFNSGFEIGKKIAAEMKGGC